MAPMEPPRTDTQVPMPRWSASMISARTWSRIVMLGNRAPQGFPSGAVLAGPVVPWQPPSMFGGDDVPVGGIQGAAGTDDPGPPAGGRDVRGPPPP